SPYIGPIIKLFCKDGDLALQVHRSLLEPSSKLLSMAKDHGTKTEIRLNDISQEAGHVLVHFLYTKTYRCLRSNDSVTQGRQLAEFRACLECYVTARKYALSNLETLMQTELERLSTEITVPNLIAILEELCPRPSQDDKWFPCFVESCVQRAFDDPQ
ncbi:hypothetical protein B0T10DRAFT_377379, partial [Thelonectria olida]